MTTLRFRCPTGKRLDAESSARLDRLVARCGPYGAARALCVHPTTLDKVMGGAGTARPDVVDKIAAALAALEETC